MTDDIYRKPNMVDIQKLDDIAIKGWLCRAEQGDIAKYWVGKTCAGPVKRFAAYWINRGVVVASQKRSPSNANCFEYRIHRTAKELTKKDLDI